jgi:integrase
VDGEIEPKSDAGPRDLPMFRELRPILEAHRDHHAKDKRPDGLVFATRSGGPFDPSEVTKRADRAWPKAKPPVERFTLHECRHGAAAVWIESGVNAKRVQRLMGHSSITTTFDIYGHLIDRSEAGEVAKVDDYLRGSSVGHRVAEHSGTERKSPPRRSRRPQPAAGRKASV